MPLVQQHDYPGYSTLGDIFNISSAASITLPSTSTPTSKPIRLIATSGQIADTTTTPYSPLHQSGPTATTFPPTHPTQFEAALLNIQKALAAASPTLTPRQLWDGVFNITSFHVGTVSQEEQLEIAAVARKYLGPNKPAWAAICVLALFPPGCLVEVQVQAAYEVVEEGQGEGK